MKKDFLPNAPLKEVLFEIHWDLESMTDEKISFDIGFEKAVMKFARFCDNNFREISILKPEYIPPIAYINRVTHRFYKVMGEHPLYQMGPGVFTINDNNKNYKWVDFIQMCMHGLNCLRSSYDKDLQPTQVQLRYIDRISPDVLGDDDKFDFLANHLQIKIEDFPFIDETLNNVQITKNYSIDHNTSLNMIVSTGVDSMTKKDVIEWHTFVINKKRLSWGEIEEWAHNAHDICSDTFNKMVSDELYEHFSK